MNTVFRGAATAWVVAAALLCFTFAPTAQEVGEADVDAQLISRTYNLRELVLSEYEITPPTGAIGDVLAPDRSLGGFGSQSSVDWSEHAIDEWSLRDSGEEARCWESASELMEEVLELCGFEEDYEYRRDQLDSTRIQVQASAELHTRVKWMLTALQELARTQITMAVYRLSGDAGGAGVVAPAAIKPLLKGSRFVGTLAGGLAVPLVLQRTSHRSYVADYNAVLAAETAGFEPVVRHLDTGEEFVFGALVLPDGRIWIQGWHAARKLKEMRRVESSAGMVELPHVSYSYAAVSTVIENGGGARIDAGAFGRFLVVAKADRRVDNRSLDCGKLGEIRLLNVVGAQRGAALGSSWLMRPNEMRSVDDGDITSAVFIEEEIDGPYNDSAARWAEAMDELEGEGGIQVREFGPFLAVVLRAGDRDEDEERAERTFEKALAAIPQAPQPVTLRVRAWTLSDKAALPKGLLDARPSEMDIAEVDRLAGGNTIFDRTTASLLNQRMDLLDLGLAAHIFSYESLVSTAGFASDPVISTQVLGKQIRWLARPAEDGRVRVELRAGLTVGPDEFEKVKFGKGKWAQTIERNLSSLAQAQFTSRLALGERASTVTPSAGPDGELLVIIVERLR